MILVDASVIIDWSERKDAKLRALMPSLPVAVCGVTQAELLHGSRNAVHRQRILTNFAAFSLISLPDALWITVGDQFAALRSGGITVPLADVIVATLAIENDIEVWARDAHFPAVQKVLPRLQLFQEPP